MIERLDVTHLLKASNKQYWFGRLDKLGKYLDRIAAYFSGSVRRHSFAALVTGISLLAATDPEPCHDSHQRVLRMPRVCDCHLVTRSISSTSTRQRSSVQSITMQLPPSLGSCVTRGSGDT